MTKSLPTGASRLTPYLTVQDADRASSFYQAAFGFVETERLRDKTGRPMHIGMSYQGASIVMFAPEGGMNDMLAPRSSGAQPPISFYVYCDDIDDFYANASTQGAEVKQVPTDMFWGDRMASFADPDGYQWAFATRIGEFDPSKVPEFS